MATPFSVLFPPQQLATNAAATIYGRVLAACKCAEQLTPEAVLAAPEADLRSAGLSGRKASYMADLARHFSNGSLSDEAIEQMEEAALEKALTAVRGIGVCEWGDRGGARGIVGPEEMGSGSGWHHIPCQLLALLHALSAPAARAGTVHMHAMFHLGSPDVLPVGDLGVRRGMQQLYGLKARAVLNRRTCCCSCTWVA